MTSEADVHRKLMKVASLGGARLFRNNVGMGWVGTVLKRTDEVLVLGDPRPFHAGLGPGSSDLIGFVPREITRDMAGQTIAQFASVEVKVGRRQATDEQLVWLAAVEKFGGVSGVARDEADLRKILWI